MCAGSVGAVVRANYDPGLIGAPVTLADGSNEDAVGGNAVHRSQCPDCRPSGRNGEADLARIASTQRGEDFVGAEAVAGVLLFRPSLPVDDHRQGFRSGIIRRG